MSIFDFRPSLVLAPRALRPALLASAAAFVVAGCGGGGGDGTPAALSLTVDGAPARCGALAGRTIDAASIGEPTTGAVVTSALYRTAVPDTPAANNASIVQATPDYCEVLVDIKPVDPSAPVIKSQVNLPTNWNGKKLQFGGSGYNGTLITGVQPSRLAGPEVALPLTRGYVTAGTDSGHQAPAGANLFQFALNAEAFVNFAYAAYKKTHDVTLQLSELYYLRKPARSYYMGGSEGGREAMAMAQRYPNDYDGIVAIDPVMNWTGLQTFGNRVGGILQSAPGAWLGAKSQLVHDTVRDACDALDGIADNVVSNYRNCKAAADAALAAKRCVSGTDEGAGCFSTAQLAAVNAAHAGYTFPFPLANGMTSYAGFLYGSEGLPDNWSRWFSGSLPPTAGPEASGIGQLYTYGNGYVRYFIAQNAQFNPLTYDPALFQARVQQVSAAMDATNPDLRAFMNRGGKLILRENLGDTAQSPQTGLDYWDRVVQVMGKSEVDRFFAAYAATGLPHTSGGIAAGTANAPAYGTPGRVDLLERLEQWVEGNTAPPDQMTLTNRAALPPYAVVASKPMCRYPTYPKYVGGSPSGGSQAANYACVSN